MSLIKTIEEVRKYVPVNAGATMENFQPYFDKVARSVIRDEYLGVTAYEELRTAYDADNLTGDQESLLALCQEAVVNLGLQKFIEPGTVQIGDVITVPYSEQSQVVSQNRKYDLKNQFKLDGYEALQSLLQFLWDDAGSVFVGYWASDQRKQHRSSVILDAKEFRKGFQIKNGYFAFSLLKSAIERAEELYLLPSIGEDFYTELKGQIEAKTLSADNTLLMPWIQKSIAPLSVFVGLNELGINIDDLGITIDGLSDRENTVKRDPAGLSQYGVVVSRAERIGLSFMNKLTTYLNTHAAADKYAAYFNSECYLSAEDKEDDSLKINNSDSGFFMV